MLIIQMIIIQVITFTALVLVLRKILYSTSFRETKRLQQLNQENAKKVQELNRRIKEAETEYKQKISRAEEEAKRLKAQATEEAEKLKQEALERAKEESQHIVNQALNTKEKLKEEIESQMREETIAQSLKLIQNVLGSKNQRSVHEDFINDIVEEIEKIEKGKFKVQTDKGEIITPYEIERSKREKIVSALSKKTGKKLSLTEKIDKELIAGITIKLGSLVIDGSLRGRLREAGEALKKG